MQSNPQIYLKGLDQMERNVSTIIRVVNKEEIELLKTQSRMVRDRIRQKAPRGPTGNLKKAAYAKVLSEEGVAFAGIRPRTAPHAHLVEYGHGGPHPAPPHPFFRPAWDGVKDEVKKNIAAGMGKAVEGAV